MKKVLTFLRSMKFGLILMALLVLYSLVGSLLPQGQQEAFYLNNYHSLAGLILALRLYRIFSSWYFIVLLAVLCANLTLCSIIRFKNVKSISFANADGIKELEADYRLTDQEKDALLVFLDNKKYKKHEPEADNNAIQVFSKNALGRYGSFAVHLSFLLTLFVGTLVLYVSKTSDYTVFVGESIQLEDGTVLTVEDFQIADNTGRLDYKSIISVTSPDGESAVSREISVNFPLSFKGYKYYQQTYGTAGSIRVVNTQTGGYDDFLMTEPSFLSADGRNGIWYEALYPGYIEDEEGHFTLITSTSGEYTDAIYQVHIISEGEMTPVFAFPGETLQVNELLFTFNEPAEYPGIRIKAMPGLLLELLYMVFAIMIIGFWLCFFHTPAVVAVHQNGYSIYGSKAAMIKLKIDILFDGMKGTD